MSFLTATAAERCLLPPTRLLLVLASLVCSTAALRADETNSIKPSADHELRVKDRPVIQRGFLPESSPRSIAVGLPGGVSYCFDAESCRLRYAWSGGFLNMKPTWDGRGAAPPGLGGEKFFIAPDAMPLRIGTRTSDSSAKFLGYALVNRLPEFRFMVDGVVVKERIKDTPDGGLRCAFELGEKGEEIWFHAPKGVRVSAAGSDLKTDAEGWARIPRGPRATVRFEVWIPGPASGDSLKTTAETSIER